MCKLGNYIQRDETSGPLTENTDRWRDASTNRERVFLAILLGVFFCCLCCLFALMSLVVEMEGTYCATDPLACLLGSELRSRDQTGSLRHEVIGHCQAMDLSVCPLPHPYPHHPHTHSVVPFWTLLWTGTSCPAGSFYYPPISL